jgi:hypothetical protein
MQLRPGESAGVAFCILGAGFRAATLRGIITGLLVASRPVFPTQVFDEVSRAVGWILATGGALFGDTRSDELTAAVQALRSGARQTAGAGAG